MKPWSVMVLISPANSLLVKHHWLLCLLLFLTACQNMPQVQSEPPIDADWLRNIDGFMQTHQSAYRSHKNLDSWRYSAKVGITTPTSREQANLVWQFADQANKVRLFGPLGVGAIKIDFDQNGVELSDNRSVLHRGESAEDLVTKIVGWPIPIDALRYWLFALPLPDKAFEYQQDEVGSLAKLRQLGWEIEYPNYKKFFLNDSNINSDGGQHNYLPSKIIASKQDENGDLIEVKLITKGWR